jgi:hypothetical protein
LYAGSCVGTRIVRLSISQTLEEPMAGNSVKNKKKYNALKRKGMSKGRAARIANSGRASSRKGGKKGGRKSKSRS